MREMDSENKDNKSEAPELPPGWTVFEAKIGTDRWRVCATHDNGSRWQVSSGHGNRDTAMRWAWMHFGITREQWAHAQECVRRLPELEAELDTAREALSEARRQRDSDHRALLGEPPLPTPNWTHRFPWEPTND